MKRRCSLVFLALVGLLALGCGDGNQVEMTVDAADGGSQPDGTLDAGGEGVGALDVSGDGASQDLGSPEDVGADAAESGDAPLCDPADSDCDGWLDGEDNCPDVENEDQADLDDDDVGDVCDEDDDGDGYNDDVDLFPLDPEEWADTDGDGIGDNADVEECDGLDNDGDGEIDEELPVSIFYVDEDEDGFYGEEAESVELCGLFPGYAKQAGDCEPDESAAYPGAEEICDLLDNNCDGVVDEGFEYQLWYPDGDADGFGAGSAQSCAGLLAEGKTEDGYYDIWPDGINGDKLTVYCDMTTDGGGWTRVFYHDVAAGYFASDIDAHEKNVDAPESGQYSILSYLESFRSSDGKLELRINWPDTTSVGRNIWRQTSNPTSEIAAGYEPVSIDHTNQYWGGLEPSGGNTYLDGSVNHNYWFYSIGSQTTWNGGIPAYSEPAARAALWVRPDDGPSGGAPIEHCKQPDGYAPTDGDCDDGNALSYPGAEEICDGADNDCNGQVDEGCPAGGLATTVAPKPLQFYTRTLGTDQCFVTIKGTTTGAAEEARLAVWLDGQLVDEDVVAGSPFSLEVPITAGLHLYEATLEWDNGTGYWKPVKSYTDIVCGDAFLIDGQSNAVAKDYQNEGLGDEGQTTFVRSWGSSVNSFDVVNDTAFGIAGGNASYAHAAIGQWGMQLAVDVMEAQQLPILIINGAVGGTKVGQHQRNDQNGTDLTTIYGRLLWRVQQAGVADSVRAVFWHQGESDGDMPYETYLDLWTAMYDDWLDDYPNIEAVYPFQVRAGCGNPTWNRNVHRDLPGLLDKVIGHMSTTGVDGHDDCHFFHAVYVEWGHRMARLVNRDLYGSQVPGNIEAPDPVSATWNDSTHLEIDFGATGGGLVLQEGAKDYFSLSDGSAVTDVAVVGQTVVLTTASPSFATWVSLVDVAGNIPWLVNDLGIGAFAFYQLPITP